MDLGTAIVGMICIAVCAMPFALISRNIKKKEKQLLESIKELAKQHNHEITQHEICGNYVIGTDVSKNFLFFQLNTKKEVKQQFIDLSTIKSCNISNISRKTANGKVVERLDLELIPKDKNMSVIVLEFYSIDLSFQLNGELQSIEKWNNLIKKQLTENK
ncbi:hypothetical protein R9C00_12045 [Flammeovirgaceae bacterium SG7u.111]|nr:hypothetical protein [Flammeovirgaceae bacterium SG7u.132]WPO38184.1 hypothetical protein R9C00_12045 [Flammeovirgaceae bacterium SG7u.111]